MQRLRRWGRSAMALGVACLLGMLVFTVTATAEDDRSAQVADGGRNGATGRIQIV